MEPQHLPTSPPDSDQVYIISNKDRGSIKSNWFFSHQYEKANKNNGLFSVVIAATNYDRNSKSVINIFIGNMTIRICFFSLNIFVFGLNFLISLNWKLFSNNNLVNANIFPSIFPHRNEIPSSINICHSQMKQISDLSDFRLYIIRIKYENFLELFSFHCFVFVWIEIIKHLVKKSDGKLWNVSQWHTLGYCITSDTVTPK